MSQEYIEVTEKNLSEAITTACQKLGVTSSRLDYIVIDPGKNGFLGIGARPAKIKARAKEAADAREAIMDQVMSRAQKKLDEERAPKKETPSPKAPEKKAPAGKPEKAQSAPAPEKKAERAAKPERPQKPARKPAQNVADEAAEAEKPAKPEQRAERSERAPEKRSRNNRRRPKKDGAQQAKGQGRRPQAPTPAPAPKKKAEKPELTPEQIEEVKAKAQTFLEDVFHAMEMEVSITITYSEEDGILSLGLEGDDMGVLIGKRGQTLDSLQYLVSLVVNKEVDGYIHVKADTENYRERRKATLENLARNISQKVKRTRKAVTLEPMNPYERRIIHSALQNDRYVTTYSVGEEPYRKVVVDLKKDAPLPPEREGRGGRYGKKNGRRNDRRNGGRRRDGERAPRPEESAAQETTEPKLTLVKPQSDAPAQEMPGESAAVQTTAPVSEAPTQESAPAAAPTPATEQVKETAPAKEAAPVKEETPAPAAAPAPEAKESAPAKEEAPAPAAPEAKESEE